jgi:3-oxoadipate enol-lactonase
LVSPVPASARMQRMLPLLFELDARPWLKSIAVPALVIGGTKDAVLPIRHACALHEALPNSEFLAVEGAGHVPVTESREEVATAVRALLARHSFS